MIDYGLHFTIGILAIMILIISKSLVTKIIELKNGKNSNYRK